jgi:hypothetical protein
MILDEGPEPYEAALYKAEAALDSEEEFTA